MNVFDEVAVMIRSAVVTGASTGIGRACVADLVKDGWHVWAAVRSDADEASLRAGHPIVRVPEGEGVSTHPGVRGPADAVFRLWELLK